MSALFVAVPGKPTGVTLLEAVKDHMVLSWTPPANNGGADIRGYFVDYRTVKGHVVGKWHELNHQALTTTSYKVSYFTSTNLPNLQWTCFGFFVSGEIITSHVVYK